MARYGPTRGEHAFRAAVSAAGLLLLAGAVGLNGFPAGPAAFEVLLAGGGFLGASLVWSLWNLFGRRDGG